MASPPAPAYCDAEKGFLETPREPEATYQRDEKKGFFSDEKKADVALNAVTVTEAKKDSRPAKPPPKPKKKVPRWILWQLWFNTYRYYCVCTPEDVCILIAIMGSKLFTFTFTLNMIGLGLAASGHWPYARAYNGAMAVANFNFAILMRNEIFGRLLYLFVNTLFAKVSHGLRTASAHN